MPVSIGSTFPVTVPDDSVATEVASITSALQLMYSGQGATNGIEDHLNVLNNKLDTVGSNNLSITGTWLYKGTEIVNASALSTSVTTERQTTNSNQSTAITTAQTAERARVNAAFKKLLPIGTIVAWVPVKGNVLGSGDLADWVLCNGQVVNGITTPNLTSKFIMGSNYPTVNAGSDGYILRAGGKTNFTLQYAHLPAHSHSITDPGHSHGNTQSLSGSHSHTAPSAYGTGQMRDSPYYQDGQPGVNTIATNVDGAHTHTITINSNTTGISVGTTPAATSFDNRPDYITLAYIMKVWDTVIPAP